MPTTTKTFDTAPERDWPGDFEQDNGCYRSLCCTCHEPFTGHKRRVQCRQCHLTDHKELTAQSQPKDVPYYVGRTVGLILMGWLLCFILIAMTAPLWLPLYFYFSK